MGFRFFFNVYLFIYLASAVLLLLVIVAGSTVTTIFVVFVLCPVSVLRVYSGPGLEWHVSDSFFSGRDLGGGTATQLP